MAHIHISATPGVTIDGFRAVAAKHNLTDLAYIEEDDTTERECSGWSRSPNGPDSCKPS